MRKSTIKKKASIGSILLLVSMLLISVSIWAGSSDITKASESAKFLKDPFEPLKEELVKVKKEEVKPYIKINNKEYSNKDFKLQKEMSDLIQRSNGNLPFPEAVVRDEFISNAVLEEEAIKQNLAVTKEEALIYSKQMRKIVKEDEDTTTKELILKYISALGISEEEYWNSYAVEAYQKALTVGKLKEKFVKEISKDGITSQKNNEINEKWEIYQKELINKSTIKIFE